MPEVEIDMVGGTERAVLKLLKLFDKVLVPRILELIVDGKDKPGFPVRVRSVVEDPEEKNVPIPAIVEVGGSTGGDPTTPDLDGEDDGINVQVAKLGTAEAVENVEEGGGDLGGAVAGGVTVIVVVLETNELIWLGGDIPPSHCVVPSTTE